MKHHKDDGAGLSVIGRSVPRIDSVEKATGSAVFVNDFRLPGMLHARVLRSPYAHATIKGIDLEKAREVPGVVAVISAAELEDRRYGAIIGDESLLAGTKVRYIGDEVAAVAAINEDVADEALGMIEVEYEELPGVFTVQEAICADAPSVHEGAVGNICETYKNTRGDVAKGFDEADAIVELEFEAQSTHAGYMEPRGCVAHFEKNGKLTVWSCTQMPYLARKTLGKVLGIPPSRIRCIQPHVGGAFGGKTDVIKETAIAAVLSRESGRPVRLVLSRTEDLACSRPSLRGSFKIKLGALADGTFTAKECSLLANNGAYSSFAPAVLEVMAARIENLYRFKNISTEASLVYTNTVPTGAVRGFGNPQGTVPVEMCIDAISEKLGLDPLEVRVKNATREGETTIHGWKISSCGFQECLKGAAAASGYIEKRRVKRPNIGIGMAGVTHVCGNRFLGFDGSSAVVKVNEDGHITVITGGGEIGQGSRTIFAMIAAEVVGANYEDVDVTMSDTDYTTYCLGYFASRGVVTDGNAVRVAAEDARRQIRQMAGTMLKIPSEDVLLGDSKAYVRGSKERFVTFEEIAQASTFRSDGAQIVGKGAYDPPSEVMDKETKYGSIAPTYSFGAQAVEVEVDPETGIVRVSDIWAVEDGGKLLNPMAAEGQVEGALGMMFGAGIMEKLEFDGGKVINANLLDYCMPTMEDMPNVHHEFVETYDQFGPFGGKAISESPGVPTLAAIANAIHDATGIWVQKLPVCPLELMEAIKKKNER